MNNKKNKVADIIRGVLFEYIENMNNESRNTKNYKFTLAYTEGNQRKNPIPEGFNTIQDAKKWVDSVNLPYYIFYITEWDLETRDFMGAPEIVLSTNFEEPAEDNAEDLHYYSKY